MMAVYSATNLNNGLRPFLTFALPTYNEALLVKTNIGGWFFDGFLEVTHNLSATATEHPIQTGANITDHIIVNPVELVMVIRMSDAHESLFPGQFTERYTRSVSADAVLKQLLRARTPLQVTTRTEIYQNMVITDYTVDDTNETREGLYATVTLREVFFATSQTVKVSERQDVTNYTYSGNLNGEELSQERQSLLYQWLGQ